MPAKVLPQDHPWLDPRRFAQRGHLVSVDRHHGAALAAPDTTLWRTTSLAALWAEQLQQADVAVHPLDLLICPSLGDALRASLTLLLHPGAVVLLAEPVAPEVLRAIVHAEAQWVDVGRTAAGDIDEFALERAAVAHPGAIYYAESPQLLGRIEPPTLALPGLRASVIDMRRHGWPTRLPPATAVVLALRDADSPQEPLLYAIATQAGLGQGLALVVGDARLADPLAERARAVLLSWRDFPQWVEAADAALAVRSQGLSSAAAAWPGLVDGGKRGLLWAAQCQAGDAAVLLTQRLGLHLGFAAYGAHPMHNLLVADLTASEFGEADVPGASPIV